MGLLQLRDSEIKAASSGKLSDGGGLFIRLTGKAKGFWVYRYSWHGQRPEMGLGAYPETSLREAREQAAKWRAVRKEEKNPIEARDNERRALSEAVPTFQTMFLETFEALKPNLKGDGKAGRWDSPVRLHILPKLGKVPIDRLTQRDLERVLKPIWTDKPDVARKALNRVNLTLKRAAAGGHDVDMQLAQKAKALLGAQRIERKHIPSMPWADVPAFYQSLGDEPPSHLALRFLILTGLRTAPVRNLLTKHGFIASMSGKGNCYDNAVVEAFFKTIKAEVIWRRIWPTRRSVHRAIFDYINGFYNPRRRHSANGGKSPLAFERLAA